MIRNKSASCGSEMLHPSTTPSVVFGSPFVPSKDVNDATRLLRLCRVPEEADEMADSVEVLIEASCSFVAANCDDTLRELV